MSSFRFNTSCWINYMCNCLDMPLHDGLSNTSGAGETKLPDIHVVCQSLADDTTLEGGRGGGREGGR